MRKVRCSASNPLSGASGSDAQGVLPRLKRTWSRMLTLCLIADTPRYSRVLKCLPPVVYHRLKARVPCETIEEVHNDPA